MGAGASNSRISAPIILCVEFLVALLLATYLLYKYGNFRKQNPFVTGCTLIVWFLSFVIIFLLPVDVSSAFYQLCLNNRSLSTASHDGSGLVPLNENLTCAGFVCTDPMPGYIHNNSHLCGNEFCFQPYSFVCVLPLEILWYIIYWLFFVLSWVVLPLGQSYVLASYFSVCKRILRALIENAIFYITFLIIFVVLFVYLVVVRKVVALENIPFLLATASNTWGLLILSLLLGYGLVEVPRTLWNASRRSYSLNHCYFKAAKLYMDLSDANEKLKEVVERVRKVSQSLHYNDPLRRYIDIIIKKFPEDLQKEFSQGHDDYDDFQGGGEDALSKSSLESLLKKTMKAVRLSNSTRIHWLALTDQTLDLEDIGLNSESRQRCFRSSVRPLKNAWYNKCLPYLEWYWKVWFRPWVYRVCAIFFALLSLVIVWCEVTFSSHKVTLSVLALLVHVWHDVGNYIAVETLSVIIVAYLSVCAYFTVFRIRIFNLYYLAPQHSTDEYSLLFSAVILSRLALPICLNYLYLIHVVQLEQHDDDYQVPDTAFAYATGNTDLIPWLTSYFYIYYPALIILVCIATLLSLGTRIVSLLGYQKFIGEDDFSADYIDEGKALMKRERRIRERNLQEHGKAVRRDQLPFELLKESKLNSIYANARRNRPHVGKPAQTPSEDRSLFERFVTKAKGVASKSKVTMSARYHSARGKRDEDALELLQQDSGSEERFGPSSSGVRSTSLREPPRDIFEGV